jgi:hypothetical protein
MCRKTKKRQHMEKCGHTMASVTASAGATRLPLTLPTAPDDDELSPSSGACIEFSETLRLAERFFFQS